jgi:hypothetical protein
VGFVCPWEFNHCVGDQDMVLSLPALVQTAALRLRSYPRGFPSIPTRGFFVQLPTVAATSPAPGPSSTKHWYDKRSMKSDASKYLIKKSASEVMMRSRGRTDVIVACLFFQSFFFELEILSAVCSELLVGQFEYDEAWLQNQFKL